MSVCCTESGPCAGIQDSFARAYQHRGYGLIKGYLKVKHDKRRRELYLNFDHKPHTLSPLYLEIMLKNSLIYGLCLNELSSLHGLSYATCSCLWAAELKVKVRLQLRAVMLTYDG